MKTITNTKIMCFTKLMDKAKGFLMVLLCSLITMSYTSNLLAEERWDLLTIESIQTVKPATGFDKWIIDGLNAIEEISKGLKVFGAVIEEPTLEEIGDKAAEGSAKAKEVIELLERKYSGTDQLMVQVNGKQVLSKTNMEAGEVIYPNIQVSFRKNARISLIEYDSGSDHNGLGNTMIDSSGIKTNETYQSGQIIVKSEEEGSVYYVTVRVDAGKGDPHSVPQWVKCGTEQRVECPKAQCSARSHKGLDRDGDKGDLKACPPGYKDHNFQLFKQDAGINFWGFRPFDWTIEDVHLRICELDRLVIAKIQNYWKPTTFLNTETGEISASTISPEWLSAQWSFEKIGDFYRIRNRSEPNEYLHIEYGQLESGKIHPDWWSAQWILIPVTDPQSPGSEKMVFKIQNRWKQNEYLHIQYGKIASSPIAERWWSALWIIDSLALKEMFFSRIQNYLKPETFLNTETGEINASTIYPKWLSAQWLFEKHGDFYRIRNRWQSDEYLHIENGHLESGQIQFEWWSAQWILTPITDDSLPQELKGKMFKIQNRWKPDEYLHMEYGQLESGSVDAVNRFDPWILTPITDSLLSKERVFELHGIWQPYDVVHFDFGGYDLIQETINPNPYVIKGYPAGSFYMIE